MNDKPKQDIVKTMTFQFTGLVCSAKDAEKMNDASSRLAIPLSKVFEGIAMLNNASNTARIAINSLGIVLHQSTGRHHALRKESIRRLTRGYHCNRSK